MPKKVRKKIGRILKHTRKHSDELRHEKAKQHEHSYSVLHKESPINILTKLPDDEQAELADQPYSVIKCEITDESEDLPSSSSWFPPTHSSTAADNSSINKGLYIAQHPIQDAISSTLSRPAEESEVTGSEHTETQSLQEIISIPGPSFTIEAGNLIFFKSVELNVLQYMFYSLKESAATISLPKQWYYLSDPQNEMHWVKISHGHNRVIQIMVAIDDKLDVKIHVHNSPVSVHCAIYQQFDFHNLRTCPAFKDAINKALLVLSKMHVCPGAYESTYQYLYEKLTESKHGSEVYLESNYNEFYQGSNYTSTIRSRSCELLLKDKDKCESCCSVGRWLRRQHHEANKRGSGHVSVHKAIAYMNKNDLVSSLQSSRKVSRSLAHKVRHLQKKMSKYLSANGIACSNALSESEDEISNLSANGVACSNALSESEDEISNLSANGVACSNALSESKDEISKKLSANGVVCSNSLSEDEIVLGL